MRPIGKFLLLWSLGHNIQLLPLSCSIVNSVFSMAHHIWSSKRWDLRVLCTLKIRNRFSRSRTGTHGNLKANHLFWKFVLQHMYAHLFMYCHWLLWVQMVEQQGFRGLSFYNTVGILISTTFRSLGSANRGSKTIRKNASLLNTSGWWRSPSMPPEAALKDKMELGEDQEALWCQGWVKTPP